VSLDSGIKPSKSKCSALSMSVASTTNFGEHPSKLYRNPPVTLYGLESIRGLRETQPQMSSGLRKHWTSQSQYVGFMKLSSICQAGTGRQRYRLMNNVVGCLKMTCAGTTLNCDYGGARRAAVRVPRNALPDPGSSSAINDNSFNS
jgi:hypothetical protein